MEKNEVYERKVGTPIPYIYYRFEVKLCLHFLYVVSNE